MKKSGKNSILIGFIVDWVAVGLLVLLFFVLNRYLPDPSVLFSERVSVSAVSTPAASQEVTPASTPEADESIAEDAEPEVEPEETDGIGITEATEEPRELTLKEKFADKFSAETEITSTSYKSPNISVEISTVTEGEGNSLNTIYVADIYISDVTCLQTYINKGHYNSSAGYMGDLLSESGGVLCINGDFAACAGAGYIVKNGNLMRNDYAVNDVCVIYRDGTLACCSGEGFDAEAAVEDGAWQVFTFGPSLLDESGAALSEFAEKYSGISGTNPRTAIGYYEPGHYCFVVVDGRQPGYSKGFSMARLASFMEELGCTAAYNLDGGKTSQMMFRRATVNIPYDGGRYVNDIVLISDITAGDDNS